MPIREGLSFFHVINLCSEWIMRTIGVYGTGLVCVALLVCQAGCLTSGRVNPGRQENLDSRGIDKIAILPVADGRRQINDGVDFEKETSPIQELMSACLSEKGYECSAVTDRAAITMDVQQIPFAEPSQIRKLGPEGTQWVMVPIVEYLDRVRGSNSRSDLACYLFDKSAGKLVWEGAASRNAIPVTIFQKRGFDIRDTVQQLLKEFPARTGQ